MLITWCERVRSIVVSGRVNMIISKSKPLTTSRARPCERELYYKAGVETGNGRAINAMGTGC